MSEHRPIIVTRNEQSENGCTGSRPDIGRYQIVTIRNASAMSASSSARQTSCSGASSPLTAGKAAGDALIAVPEVASGLRIRTPFRRWPKQQRPRNGRGLCPSSGTVAYFSELLIEVNLVF